ncbi:hypothetical protein A2U01_0081473, partial [Trifolium medium]|nr:hypothetical protein [Trifolium medium]
FDHTAWEHNQNVCVSSYGYSWAHLGSSVGARFAVAGGSVVASSMVDEVEAWDMLVAGVRESPMVLVSEAGMTKGFLPSPTGFV